MRLSATTKLPMNVGRSSYDRENQKVGIVHFGIGAFHRAHQAVYADNAMADGNRDWMITGVSLRSSVVADQLNPQDGLYTVAVRGPDTISVRLVRSIQEVLVANQKPQAVIAAIAAPTTRIISFTITEKGYHRDAGGRIDFASVEGVNETPRTIYGFLRYGLRRRMDAALPGVTLLSCDNLAANGRQLKSLLLAYLDQYDPTLAAWVVENCTFPSTMVDRIVPATTADDQRDVEAVLGVRDEAVVVTEPFSQWVIEDEFAAGRPQWELYGAQMASAVDLFEKAKLRLLNGAHSMLAYVGLEKGYQYVHDAIADPKLAGMARRLMLDEAAPTVKMSTEELNAYATTLLERFSNPALPHRLVQIAMDGSQKIPQRWLETMAERQQQGAACPVLRTAVVAWLNHIKRGTDVNDPLHQIIAAQIKDKDEGEAVRTIFGPDSILRSGWVP